MPSAPPGLCAAVLCDAQESTCDSRIVLHRSASASGTEQGHWSDSVFPVTQESNVQTAAVRGHLMGLTQRWKQKCGQALPIFLPYQALEWPELGGCFAEQMGAREGGC